MEVDPKSMSLDQLIKMDKKKKKDNKPVKKNAAAKARDVQGGRPRFGQKDGKGAPKGGKPGFNPLKAKKTGATIQKSRQRDVQGGRPRFAEQRNITKVRPVLFSITTYR